jgi:hypothetical protein
MTGISNTIQQPSLATLTQPNSVQTTQSQFDEIDKLNNSAPSNSQFSSEAQFKFNLQSHAHTLEGKERTEYVNFLEKNNYLDSENAEQLKAGEHKFEFTESEELQNRSKQIEAMFNSNKNYEPIAVSIVGSVDKNMNMLDRFNNHEARDANGWQGLEKNFEALTQKAFDELSTQDATALTDYIGMAVNSSQNYFYDTSPLYDTSFNYGMAQRVIDNTEMSDELKTGFNSLLDRAVDMQSEIFATELRESKESYDKYPQYQKEIGASIDKLEEIIPIFEKTVNLMKNDMSLVTDSGAGFKSLIQDTKLSNDLSDKAYYKDFTQHYENHLSIFDRIHIDKDWTPGNLENNTLQNELLAEQYEVTQKLSDSFIHSISKLLSIES